MTMTASLPSHTRGWTIDNLFETPDDGNRYELADGSLLVTPPPNVAHIRGNACLHDILSRACPPGLHVLSFGGGIDLGQRKTCYIPDTLVTTETALGRDDQVFAAADIALVVEVLSPSNARVDLILKRHDYGAAGIPQYWIVDTQRRTLTVLSDPYADGYQSESTVKAGELWTATEPFTVTLDPAGFT